MDDLISRTAALDAIDGMKPMQGNMEQLAMKALCWAAVKSIPAVDAVPVVHARWNGGEFGTCSACGHYGCASDIWDRVEGPGYCPHCGAKMDLEV